MAQDKKIYSIVNQIVSLALKEKVNALWVVLQGQTMVRLAKLVSEKLNIPFSDDENEKLKGVGRPESLDKILSWAKMNISDSEKEILLEEKNDHYRC